jgi:hypothetical protein
MPEWPFWKKRKPPVMVDPLNMADIALDYFLSHKKPFSYSDWIPPDLQIPSEHAELIRFSVLGYQLFTYLKLVENKFGSEVARIIQEHQIIALNRLPERIGDEISQLLQDH